MEGVATGTEFSNLEPELQNLLHKSLTAREKAYCPYSKFKVGAALLCEDGVVSTGCNVENASFGLSTCAERTAIVKAVSEGRKKFKAIAVAAEMKTRFVGPCGACRQILGEFGMEIDIYLCKPNLMFIKTSIAELMPLNFTPEWVSFNDK